jgi:hypothetical protein
MRQLIFEKLSGLCQKRLREFESPARLVVLFLPAVRVVEFNHLTRAVGIHPGKYLPQDLFRLDDILFARPLLPIQRQSLQPAGIMVETMVDVPNPPALGGRRRFGGRCNLHAGGDRSSYPEPFRFPVRFQTLFQQGLGRLPAAPAGLPEIDVSLDGIGGGHPVITRGSAITLVEDALLVRMSKPPTLEEETPLIRLVRGAHQCHSVKTP